MKQQTVERLKTKQAENKQTNEEEGNVDQVVVHFLKQPSKVRDETGTRDNFLFTFFISRH